jgi:hypothetical protein
MQAFTEALGLHGAPEATLLTNRALCNQKLQRSARPRISGH